MGQPSRQKIMQEKLDFKHFDQIFLIDIYKKFIQHQKKIYFSKLLMKHTPG